MREDVRTHGHYFKSTKALDIPSPLCLQYDLCPQIPSTTPGTWWPQAELWGDPARGAVNLAGFHPCLQGQAPTSALRVETKPHPAGSAGQEILCLRPHLQPKTEKGCLTGSSDRGLHKPRTLGTSASTPPLLSRDHRRPLPFFLELLSRAQWRPWAGEEGLKPEPDGNQTCRARAKERRGPHSGGSRGQGWLGGGPPPSNSSFPCCDGDCDP